MSKNDNKDSESRPMDTVDIRLNELAEHFGEDIARLASDFNRLICDPELASLDIPMERKEENVLNILHFECSQRMEE